MFSPYELFLQNASRLAFRFVRFVTIRIIHIASNDFLLIKCNFLGREARIVLIVNHILYETGFTLRQIY